MTDWVTEYSNSKPQEFQKAGPKTWIQRKGITQNYEKTAWTDQMRFLTEVEYEQVKSQKELIKQTVEQMTGDLSKYEEGYNAALILLGEEA